MLSQYSFVMMVEYVLEIIFTFDTLVVSSFPSGSLFKLHPYPCRHDLISATGFEARQNVPASYCAHPDHNKQTNKQKSAHSLRSISSF